MSDIKDTKQRWEGLGEAEPTLFENAEVTHKRLLAYELAHALFDIKEGQEVQFAGSGDLQELFNEITAIANDPESTLYKRLYSNEDQLADGLTPINPEALQILEKRINSTDQVTGLPRRDVQTERLREKIAHLQHHQEDYEAYTNRVALITFDVRGLKMVNDVMKDHKFGDAYLRAIVDNTKEYILPVLQEIVGKGTIDLARDGGDEFSLLLESEERTFNEEITTKEFADQFESMDMGSEFVAHMGEGTHPLLHIINQYIEFRLAKIPNTIIPHERLQEFAKAGEDPGYQIPEDFEMKFYVASGSSTLNEVVDRVSNEDFKEDLDRMGTGEFPIPEIHKTQVQKAKFSVNKLMGALRTRADRRSYQSKSEQNQAWIESDRELDQLMIKMISRNDVTISLAKKAQREQLARKDAEQQLRHTTDLLDTCLGEKAALEVQKS